jgi:chromosome segregation protein
MYFKKLELVGFKSFANKTALHFEPGITAVVGPNGCGKSNVFDSIRWVLGEQSVKALRGSKMEDVIFNGTDNKEPVGLAEVSLTFSNESKVFAVDADEVTVTRRLFRSGDSEYLLNKSLVRLKDMNELFMGTGIGAEAYSLVEQGKIDLILSSRPEERRVVFDEASGITRYKAQKKEAMRRLEETDQNLLRINDIITEVKRQIGSLERQANKARRYREVFEELKAKEVSLASVHKKTAFSDKQKMLDNIASLESAQQSNYLKIQEIETRIQQDRQEVEVIEKKISQLKEQISDLESLADKNSQHIRINKERIVELAALKESLIVQIAQLEKRISLDEEKLSAINSEFESVKTVSDAKEALISEKEKEQEGIHQSIRSANDLIARSKSLILDLVNKQSVARNNILDLNAKLQNFLAREKRLDIEAAKVIGEKMSAQAEMEAAQEKLNSIQAQFDEQSLSLSVSKDICRQESEAFESLKQKIQELEQNKLNLISQKEFLDKLRLKYEDISESMNAVILLDRQPQEKLSGLVVKVNDTGIVNESDKQFLETASFKLLGEAKPMPLNTEDLQLRINEVIQALEVKAQERAAQQEKLNELNKKIEEEENLLRQQEMLLNNQKTEYKNISEQLSKIIEEKEIVDIELVDVKKELESLRASEAALKEELAGAERGLSEQEELISGQQASIASFNALREENLVLLTKVKAEQEALSKRVAALEDTRKMLEDTYLHDRNTLIESREKIRDFEEKTVFLSSQIEELEKSISDAAAEKEKIIVSLDGLNIQDAQLRGNFDNDTALLEEAKTGVEKVKDELYSLQMQSQELDYKYASIKERMLQAYKVDLDTIDDNAEVPPDLDAIITQVEVLKDKLNSYGTVNLVAIEEYDELKKRYDFLTQQQTDLVTAKDALHEAILKINRTTRKMFLETFTRVAEEFRGYFKILFNGGDAQIFLVDENEPLESGIEIICRPPGKKLQNVLLLSGGEKAMSAIALLFAIFKVKPSPFCVLDEIDAALDEANVDRYNRILHDFSQTTQFIVISHNKKTIVNADVMYGITMEESGVSKVVSVKFHQSKPVAQLVPSTEAEPVAVN